MKNLEYKNWQTGLSKQIDFSDVIRLIKEHTLSGSKIFIGSDSFINKKKICFASAICLHGGELGNRYFFFREFVKKTSFLSLSPRITEEVQRSLDIACVLVENFSFSNDSIELHMDISPSSSSAATSWLSDMLKGYVSGFGLDCKIKPDAWASQSIADRHSK
jgi:predicted RNase H-related nuclease YkuK (DUF458 family)